MFLKFAIALALFTPLFATDAVPPTAGLTGSRVGHVHFDCRRRWRRRSMDAQPAAQPNPSPCRLEPAVLPTEQR
jgi:hypothetical protein